MNKSLLGFAGGLVLGSGATWLWMHRGAMEKPAGHREVATSAAAVAEKTSPLHLSAAQRDRAGITLVQPEARSLAPEVQAFGRVLDPSSLAAGRAELTAAQAALDASEKELERVKKLFAAGGNASAQSVETAEASTARDRAALNSAQSRLLATWGRAVVEDAPAIADAVAKGGALIRLDSLPGEAPSPDVKEARVTPVGQTSSAFSAEILGPAPTADAQTTGVGTLALVREGSLPIGMPLRATLRGRGEVTPAFALPRSALVYHEGSAWIYVLDAEDTFERKRVEVGRSMGSDQVAILAGAQAGESVAATGAQQLLAAELQSGKAEEP